MACATGAEIRKEQSRDLSTRVDSHRINPAGQDAFTRLPHEVWLYGGENWNASFDETGP